MINDETSCETNRLDILLFFNTVMKKGLAIQSWNDVMLSVVILMPVAVSKLSFV